MRFALTTLVVISFASIAVFGFFAMNHESGHSNSLCIAATTQSGVCPENGSRVALAAFHLGAYRTFTNAIVDVGILNILIAVLSFLLLFIVALDIRKFRAEPSFVFLKKTPSPPQPIRLALGRWLALHENSPNTF